MLKENSTPRIQHEQQPEEPEQCPNCGKMIDPYDMNTHPACCKGGEK